MEEDVELEQSDSETNGSSVSYYKWCRREKKIQKMLLTIDQGDAVEQWNESITNLKQHIYRKRVQAAEFNTIKENLQEAEVLLQVDYSF